MNGINWGDVPTWLGAIFAALAAAAAVWTLKSQRDQIREQQRFIGEQQATMDLERTELRAVAEDRRTAQAKRVRMHHRKAGATTDWQGAEVPDDHWVVTVVNESDVPIRQVEVHFGTAHRASEVHEWHLGWHESRTGQGERLMTPVHLLGPRRAAEFQSQSWSPSTVHNNPPTLYFTDGDGGRWSLDSSGDLKESEQQPGM
ncbi:hypothetical protein ACFYOF_16945 [Streptomyces sp. NPDC007148]|uniref:hypothetical protein n=1 Tax=Streptomyces sp. NPDC007148 TaxID=3364775 RepID=UPI00369B2F91